MATTISSGPNGVRYYEWNFGIFSTTFGHLVIIFSSAILMQISLEKPFTLLEERDALRDNIEQQKETLRKSKNWQAIFSLTERKKSVDYDKDKVVQNMNELNHIDSQINQSHKMISDELAHFQSVHPKEMIKSIKHVTRAALALEKHKLSVLEHTFTKWNFESVSGTTSI